MERVGVGEWETEQRKREERKEEEKGGEERPPVLPEEWDVRYPAV